MMRSLYSAITGLKNHQMSMDVIGNNIANVNTAGYKKARTTFATMLGQEIRGASAPDINGAYGGTNGIAVGLGSVLGSVDKVMGQGSSQYTGKDTDMMIQGDGMFVLKMGVDTVYTRAGNFGFDKTGNLIDPASGAFLQGYNNTVAAVADNTIDVNPDPAVTEGDSDTLPDIPPSVWSAATGKIQFKLGDPLGAGAPYDTFKLTSYSIDQYGVITGVFSDGNNSLTREMYKIAIAGFSNPAGLTATGKNYYKESNNSGVPSVGAPGTSGRGTIVPNSLEMSNVDLSQEFTDMIVTQRGFQANSRVITVSDTILQELIDLKRN